MRHPNKRLRGADSRTLDGSTFSQQINNARMLVANNEQGEARRAKAYVKRLHPAKYLSCDALMKEIFFPLMTYAQRFGFCSTTGLGGRTALLMETSTEDGQTLVPSDPSSFSKSNGCHRGLALFTIRSSAIDNANSKLNTIPQKVGTTEIGAGAGSQRNIYSAYRRFNNGPILLPTATEPIGQFNNASEVSINQTQFVNFDGPQSGDAEYNSSNIRVSEVGNIQDIEQSAFAAQPFVHSLVGTGVPYGQGGIHVPSENNNPDVPGQLNPSNGQLVDTDTGDYYATYRNTTIRIADGYLEMDITNGKSQSTFIEIVIFAHKKHGPNTSTQQLLDTIQSCVHYQQSQMVQEDVVTQLTTSQQEPGGWQALYDPTYPLLGCKSQHRKPIDDIANEVHRSCHMLSAGQSKCVKIFLGNLYYDIAGKSKNDMNTINGFGAALGIKNAPTGVGALQIAVGHSGVMQLTAPTIGSGSGAPDFSVLPDNMSGNGHSVPGAGYWVGKQFCPSEIVVNGNYVEKYYPAYHVDKQRRNFQDAPLRAPWLFSTQGDLTLPAGLPVQEVIGTVSGKDSVPQNTATPYRQEL